MRHYMSGVVEFKNRLFFLYSSTSPFLPSKQDLATIDYEGTGGHQSILI